MTEEERQAIATLNGQVGILNERTANIQENITEIKGGVVKLNTSITSNLQRFDTLAAIVLGDGQAKGLCEKVTVLEVQYGRLSERLLLLIGTLTGMGILGGTAWGIIKLWNGG